jgi:two-component system sensor histidine kinase DegS
VIASLNLDKNILSFEIVDNGIGLNINSFETKGTFGILGIRERVSILNGKLQITSSIGIGTTIRFTIPI